MADVTHSVAKTVLEQFERTAAAHVPADWAAGYREAIANVIVCANSVPAPSQSDVEVVKKIKHILLRQNRTVSEGQGALIPTEYGEEHVVALANLAFRRHTEEDISEVVTPFLPMLERHRGRK